MSVLQVVEVSATAGLVAPQHLFDTPTGMIVKLQITCNMTTGYLLELVVRQLVMCPQQSAWLQLFATQISSQGKPVASDHM